jgi:hypothetical protein
MRFDEKLADKHAKLFTGQFINILEVLLSIWPQYSNNKRYPYPSVRELKKRPLQQQDGDKQLLLSKTNFFMLQYFLAVVGDAGWKKKTCKGYQPVSSEQ